MYYQDPAELEDDLYREDEGDSDGSEVNSELEFHLYSQLHYSNPGDEGAEVGQEDGGQDDSLQQEVTEKAPVDDRGEESTTDSRLSEIKQPEPPPARKGERSKDEKKRKIQHVSRKPSSFLEEVIVIDSGPDIISISDSDTSADDVGVCSLKGQRASRPQTSTPAPQVRKGVTSAD